MEQIVECVPNFSEGRDKNVIAAIAARIRAVDGVSLLDVDPGADTNRTVFTFVGAPDAVVNGAFAGIKAASELIDMTKHSGAHARHGACDVCPFVPISGITMEECVALAHELGERVGQELNLPGYYYEHAALTPKRRNLADVRKGEYEAVAEKMTKPEWKPDFGPTKFVPEFGVVTIGVREFLIAYNVNINSKVAKLAHNIALNIREQGRYKRDKNRNFILDENGEKIKQPGTLKEVKGIGWYIEEYGCAQLSMNLTNYKVTNIHEAFEEIRNQARTKGLRVTGSELVGLVPKIAMIEAGKFYLKAQGLSAGIPERQIIDIAIRSMGLNELTPFDPDKKIIEYCMKGDEKLLRDMRIVDFTDELSSDSPAPGGGSIAALCGSIAASLASMVAALTCGKKKKMPDVYDEMAQLAEKAQDYKDRLNWLIDEDTAAFNKVMDAMKLPKGTEAEKAARTAAMDTANLYAAEIPLNTLKTIQEMVGLVKIVVEKGNPSSITDGGVGGLMARAGAKGAWYNVMINLSGIDNQADKDRLTKEAKEALQTVNQICDEIETLVEKAL